MYYLQIANALEVFKKCTLYNQQTLSILLANLDPLSLIPVCLFTSPSALLSLGGVGVILVSLAVVAVSLWTCFVQLGGLNILHKHTL